MLLKNQISMEDLLLNNMEVFEDENIDSSQNQKELLKNDDLRIEGIDITTFDIINDFLFEIKKSSKFDKLNRSTAIKCIAKRQETYEELYDKYYDEVLESDKAIYSKLINYITSEASNTTTYGDGCSNMQMYLEYKVRHKSKEVKGVYRADKYFTMEGQLVSELSDKLYNELNDSEDTSFSAKLNFIDNLKIEVHSSYDIEFNLDDLRVLQRQVKDILNSNHFISWKFSGKRDEEQQRILRYIYGAKHEVMSHRGRGEIVCDNISVDTCRYVGYLLHCTKVSRYKISSMSIDTVDEKTKLYNELYPYLLNEINENDKEIFAKLANYLAFENEDYCIHGYNEYSVTSKEDALKRLDLLKAIIEICKNGKVKKSKKQEVFDTYTNHSTFTFNFIHGAGVSSNKEWVDKRYKELSNILTSDSFKNWEFSGLKTEAENSKRLEYVDIFKEINFSENSYYALGIVLNHINEETTLEKRKAKKSSILKSIMNYIPLSEQKTFNILLNYYTNENEAGFNIPMDMVSMNVRIIRKSDGISIGRFINREFNKYSDIPKEMIIKGIDRYHSSPEITEDNLYDMLNFEYTINTLGLPKSLNDSDKFRNKELIKNKFSRIIEEFNTINSIDNKIEDENTLLLEDNIVEISKEDVVLESNLEENNSLEGNLFDILYNIEEKEISKTDKKNIQGQLAFLV